jgi:hypothetical protein
MVLIHEAYTKVFGRMPDRYVECGGTLLSDLGYNLAATNNIPVEGVLISGSQVKPRHYSA